MLSTDRLSAIQIPQKSITWDDFANDEIGPDAYDHTPYKPKKILHSSLVWENLGVE